MNYNIISYVQILYFLLTAAWPFVHLESFLAVTGPKTDLWLVKTVALLLLPYILLIVYIEKIKNSPFIMLSIILGSLGLAGIDLYYYVKGIIRWVYLIDFALELIFIIYWAYRMKLSLKK